MTPPKSLNEEAHEWLRVAARDLKLGRVAVELDPALTGAALYHAQQAAEKALKGFLVSRGVAYPLTHDVKRLLKLCRELDRDMVDGLSEAAELTQFVMRFRYPGEKEPTRDEALPWLAIAQNVYDEVLLRLPPAG